MSDVLSSIFSMKTFFLIIVLLASTAGPTYCWGFYAHRQINYYAVFLLPPEMIGFYKKHSGFLADHAVDPDKRRYAVAGEGPKHYIDMDSFGEEPYDSIPVYWDAAVKRYGEDSLMKRGIVPWWINRMFLRLTRAFRDRDAAYILKTSADIGHYISDAHVPLHACSNHNGQHTNQHGIHGFWESRIPERFAPVAFDFVIGRARYLERPQHFIWARVLESAAAADTVLKTEKSLSQIIPEDARYAFEERNGVVIRQYSSFYTQKYHEVLDGMVERRMRQSIYAVASFWYTAWVDAGQPDLDRLDSVVFTDSDRVEWDSLNRQWKADEIKGRDCH